VLSHTRLLLGNPHDMLVATRVPNNPNRAKQGYKRCKGKEKKSEAQFVCTSVEKFAVASAVEVFEDDGWRAANVTSSQDQTCTKLVRASRKYSINDLLVLRKPSINADTADVGDECAAGLSSSPSVNEEVGAPLVSFRSSPAKGAISFHVDMDVPKNCIVNVGNIDNRVEWPQLNTFCAKTVGVKPLSIRMQRRTNPASAHILFNTPAEASEFLSRVPPGVRIKGRKPRFYLHDSGSAGGAKDAAVEKLGGDDVITSAVVVEEREPCADDSFCKK